MKKKINTKKISNKELEDKFNKGESVLEFFDTEKPIKRVNVDFNAETVKELDRIAKGINITRQSLIKFWISDKIKEEKIAK
jgi:hypothetical protein